MRSYAKTDIKFGFYAKNYVYRLIFSPVRPDFSLIEVPSSRSRISRIILLILLILLSINQYALEKPM